MYLFSCRLRRFLTAVCGHKYFDYVVLFFILISCVVLALEEPNIPPDHQVRTQSNNESCVILLSSFVRRVCEVTTLLFVL